MRKLKILVLTHPDLVPPDVASSLSAREAFEIKTEADVISTLRKLGHDVHVLGVQWELRPVREAVDVLNPDIVFNLLEEFHGETVYDHNVVGFLELMKVPYTGCNPRGLMLSRGKALSKKLLATGAFGDQLGLTRTLVKSFNKLLRPLLNRLGV